MVSNIKVVAEDAGKKEWGNGGPSDTRHYKNWLEEPFFRRDGN